MKWRAIETARGVRCRVLEGGSGTPLVFFHGAAGLLHDNPFLDALARRYSVFAPELPGYGESTGEELLEDMLDFTLHGWDVVAALGLDRPHLVGHSMGGMIAAEMACLAPKDLDKLVLASAAGLWMDEHPIPDVFSILPFELVEVLFHDTARGSALLTGGLDLDGHGHAQDVLSGQCPAHGHGGQDPLPGAEPPREQAAVSPLRADARALGRARHADPARLRRALGPAHPRRPRRAHRERRAHAALGSPGRVRGRASRGFSAE